MHVNGYDPNAKTPMVGSRWVWEIDKPLARTLIEVAEVKWNGEEWWVKVTVLFGTEALYSDTVIREGEHLNDLSRFMEAVTPIGGTTHSLLERRAPVSA